MFASVKRLNKPRRVRRSQSVPAIPYHPEPSSATSDEEETVNMFPFLRKGSNRSLDRDGSIDSRENVSPGSSLRMIASLPPTRAEKLYSTSSARNASMPPRVVQQQPRPAAAALERSVTSRNRDRNHPLVKALVAALQKEHMLDVTLIGRDGAQVRASRYVLACRCEALEKKLYHTGTHLQEEHAHVGDYTEQVLRGLVEYCFTGQLAEFGSGEATPSTVRDVVELSRLAVEYRFRLLKNEVYQLARKIMNCHASLASLFYDEATSDIKSYARQTLQECPSEALFAPQSFVHCISAKGIEELVRDVEELDAIRLCVKWMNTADAPNATEVARRCASTIDLTEVRLTESVETMLQESGLFDEDVIRHAMESACSEKERTDVDRVSVEGAGDESVNGIYYKSEDEECIYTQECGTISLHCWNDRWHIGRTVDLSCSLYISTPMGWQSVLTEHNPPPQCTWMPKGAESPDDPFSSFSSFPLEQDLTEKEANELYKE